MSDGLSDEMKRIIEDGVRGIRDDTLRFAVEICETLARDGGTAEECVRALRDFREMTNDIRPRLGKMS